MAKEWYSFQLKAAVVCVVGDLFFDGEASFSTDIVISKDHCHVV